MEPLNEVMERLEKLSEEEKQKLSTQAGQLTQAAGMGLWQPNPGSQQDAYFSLADETGFGGEAGPGKTELIIGLSVTCHKHSLVLRRTNKEAIGLFVRYEEIIGNRDGLNASQGLWRVGDKLIEIGGCEREDDKQKRKGQPRDLIAFDEVVDFTESQYTFIIQWNRSVDPNQRCRVVATFNPPTKPSGLWVIRRWGPWLDPHHPRPAKSGEIRWYTMINGEDTEVDGPGPHDVGDEKVMAKSRTFIRGYLHENVELYKTGYDATRAAAPEALRSAYREGDFEAALADVPNQVCPSAWVREAVHRWTQRPPMNIPMCAIACDASGGGPDPMVLAIRYDGWYDKMIVTPGKDIPIDRAGKYGAGQIMSYRRDQARVIVDMGGGYGGSIFEQLKENDIEVDSYKGAESSSRRTKDGQLGFANKRAEVYWRFREALDPSEPGGSPIFLPDDSLLIADLLAPVFMEDRKVLILESKEKTVERLGRSTDRGDAVVMAWACGPRYVEGGMALDRYRRYSSRPQVVMRKPGRRR